MLRVQVYPSIKEIGAESWAGLADPQFPFSHYHFLVALENSDCVGERTGWFSQFVTAWDGSELAGALILYLKTNSYGEYIFDFAWAEAYQRSGLTYYPKLTSAIPFTPATGPKLLLRHKSGRSAADTTAIELALLAGADQVATLSGAGSLHSLFVPEAQLKTFRNAGYFERHSFQFHWQNQDYVHFDDFTAQLRSKRRKEILRERAQVALAPVRISRLTGAQIQPDHAEIFYRFYLSTIEKRSSYDYLTEDLFKEVFRTMPEKILLVFAHDEADVPVAGALYYFGDDVLYGRNWGCLAEYRSLHFELCYYQGIEFAIERKMKRFEAGAQGEHKFQRGFLPALTFSAHKLSSSPLQRAVEDHVQFEKEQIARAFEDYGEHSPFARREP